jgi:type I restriction enzyme R subunit
LERALASSGSCTISHTSAALNYLIEHSAGSGKSNTIAWTAHRLSSLHDDDDRKVFDKVIVITDRVILDKQLQETIYQFEHVRGVVVRIDRDSTQLASALKGEQARIIITTLQKFPFVLEQVKDLPRRRYAVIIDEAHSSQTGETAKELRVALSEADEQELTVAEAEDAGFIATVIDPVEEALARAVRGRGPQRNLSFFAFTATPKGRTLALFGTFNPATGKYEPFHLYSMRQAIEEEFILDVLASYTTYQTYWNIQKTIAENLSTRRHRQGGRSPGTSPCIRRTSPKRPKSSSSTSVRTPPGRSMVRPKRCSSPPRACTRCATSRRSTPT